jgi:hypothetical protein
METLPQELVDRIIYYVNVALQQPQWIPYRNLEDPCPPTLRLASYASTCRTWKEAIEALNFSRITVKDSELETFQTIVTGRRRTYVTELGLAVTGLDGRTRVGEPLEEQSVKNRRFTNSLCKFFQILEAWQDEGVRKPLRLVFPMVYEPPLARLRAMNEIESFVFTYLLTGLSEHLSLPKLSNVTYLNVYGGSGGRLEPSTATTIVSALPNLREIALDFGDESANDKGQSIRMRASFAEAIKNIRLLPRAAASIKYRGYIPFDQGDAGENFVPSHLFHDPLSAALRTFSQDLSSLSVTTSLDSTIFWPSLHESNYTTPHWPFLKDLNVNLSLVSPTGSWYFTGPDPNADDYDSSGEDSGYWQFRGDADPVTFTPFIEAFAKAVGNMPILESFHLESDIMDDEGRTKFSIMYHAPGRDAEPNYDDDEDDNTARRVTYDLTDDAEWRPSHEVREALKNVGRERFGGEVIETFRVGIKPSDVEESDIEESEDQ